ncbi:MAG: Ig-like domain-containing protein [Candidatus Limivicinus sp.]|jgi:predicted metal-binding transcription factor (methanogenesis marker protein 9)
MKQFKKSIFAICLALFLVFTAAVPAFAENSAPKAESFELRTFRNTSVGGKLIASDPEGDKLGYTITTEPVKGKIELNRDGSFVYTPDENKKGRDYFGYKAIDIKGNVSQEATVIIRIEKQKTDVLYSDMSGRGAEYAAVLLSEEGIFTGEKIGEKYCFNPKRAVSRGEFLSLCMLTADKPSEYPVMKTGFSDDKYMPVWMKENVANATIQGIYSRKSNENGTGFDADAPITKSEAAQALDKILDNGAAHEILTDGVNANCETGSGADLNNIKGAEDQDIGGDCLSREEMAHILAKVITALKK